jgi:hypothetical protein
LAASRRLILTASFVLILELVLFSTDWLETILAAPLALILTAWLVLLLWIVLTWTAKVRAAVAPIRGRESLFLQHRGRLRRSATEQHPAQFSPAQF